MAAVVFFDVDSSKYVAVSTGESFGMAMVLNDDQETNFWDTLADHKTNADTVEFLNSVFSVAGTYPDVSRLIEALKA